MSENAPSDPSSDLSGSSNVPSIRYTVAGSPSKPAPGLYIVATPIGNLRDITLRALDILSQADLVLCEDTRITRRLFDAYGITTKLLAYHDHNAEKIRPRVMEDLASGKIIAQVSDAGTPLVSDPGYKLVRDAVEAGREVFPIPGPSAALAALAAAGLPTDRFLFAGFLPVKDGARRKVLEELSGISATLIFYETGPRIRKSLATLAELFPNRQAAVMRELTKRFEEHRRGTASELATYFAERDTPKGEIVLLVGPPEKGEQSESGSDIDAMLREELQSGASVKDAAGAVSRRTGHKRKEVYSRALQIHAESTETENAPSS